MSYVKTRYKKSGPGKRPKFAAFDVETDGLGGSVIAASWIVEGMEEAEYISGRSILPKLFEIMKTHHEFTWYAHNLQYELRYFVEKMLELRDDTSIYLRTDSDVFMVNFRLPENGEKAVLSLRDSFALFPSKLKRKNKSDSPGFADVFVPEIEHETIDFENDRFDPTNTDHIRYSKLDSQRLLLSLIRYDDLIFEQFGIHIRTTAASTALAAWERTLEKDEIYGNPKSVEGFVRSGYYGGLVFLTDTNTRKGAKTYDVNSSYPFQMLTNDMPYGTPIDTSFYESGVLGMYRVTVSTPPDLIVPCLPKRDNLGICWPSGVFETTVTNVEIDFALEHGYRLLQVHEGIVWPETVRPFEKFISKCKYLRFTFKGTAVEVVAKLMQNSLYGKFASKRERKKLYTSLPDDEIFGCEMWGDFWIRTETDDEMMALPQWAAFITAYGRRHLLSCVYTVGPENVLYGDTDSLTIREGNELPTGTDYGQLKLEKEWTAFKARAPKVYSGIIRDGYKGAIKGVPRSKWQSSGALEVVFKGEDATVSYETMNSLVRVIKGDEKQAYTAKRSISKLENSRNWQLLPDGKVRPKSYDEIQKHGKRRSVSTPDRNGMEETNEIFARVK